ncbi:MAG: barstar family protein [Actinomycetota bacterium]|nr:barstar family protein [Actinomycetota bacterium]
MTEYVVDGSGIRSKRAMYAALAGALSFPDWFGHNLDGLYDCLTDLSWLPKGAHTVIWSHPEVLAAADPAGYRAIREVLDDAADGATDPDRTLTVVFGDG